MKRRTRKYVKKYLAALAPLALAGLFALNYATVYSRDSGGFDFAHRYTLIDFITENWFYVGAVISGAVVIVMLVYDLTGYLAKRHHRGGTGGMALTK